MANEVSQQIAREFEQAIIKVLESHGISNKNIFLVPEPDSQRIHLGVEIDNALRLRRFIVSVRITNRETMGWN